MPSIIEYDWFAEIIQDQSSFSILDRTPYRNISLVLYQQCWVLNIHIALHSDCHDACWISERLWYCKHRFHRFETLWDYMIRRLVRYRINLWRLLLLSSCSANIAADAQPFSWWHHQIIFPSQRPVTQSFDVSFDLRLNKWLRKQSRHRWLETSSR